MSEYRYIGVAPPRATVRDRPAGPGYLKKAHYQDDPNLPFWSTARGGRWYKPGPPPPPPAGWEWLREEAMGESP